MRSSLSSSRASEPSDDFVEPRIGIEEEHVRCAARSPAGVAAVREAAVTFELDRVNGKVADHVEASVGRRVVGDNDVDVVERRKRLDARA